VEVLLLLAHKGKRLEPETVAQVQLLLSRVLLLLTPVVVAVVFLIVPIPQE
jgi:hypothetical protein